MNSQDLKILKYISNLKSQVKIQLVASANKMSTDYAQLICRSLERAGYISLIRSNLCQPTSKGSDFIKNGSEKIESANAGAEYGNDDGLTLNLIKAGYKTVADLAAAPLAKLTQNFNISVKKSAELINKARERLKNSNGTYEPLENVLKQIIR